MLPRSLHSALLACLLLASALSIEGAKRRSRLDLPISKPADAPLEDNIATASGVESAAVVVERGEPLQSTGSPPASTEADGVSSSSGSAENSSQMIDEYTDEDCDPDFVAFELVTGYVFSAPNKLLDSIPGTLMLTDCLEACQSNDSCSSVNYETGLCVLFSSNSDKLPGALTKSQFPVFTIYAQKSCLKLRPCERAWCIDRVQGYKLQGHVKRTASVINRRDCLEMCLGENEFTCRSANFYQSTMTCELSDMDRITLAGSSAFQAADEADYLENNCAEEPTKLCEFKRMSGRILKTVDSVYQDVASVDECRELCLSSPYRCHSYDYGDTGDMVCRLSHHSRATLADIQDPYLDVPEAATYELSSCYNVSIECRAGDMIAKIRTSKLFDGKVYAKGAPNSCSVDVKNSLEFELRMGYQDIDCNVRQNGLGRYLNDVVIQHHDTIVTSSDLGLAVTCQYDLTNKTVSNDVDLDVTGDIEPALSEEVVVDSPTVVMKITSRDGSDMMRTAEVGDPLALRFEILDAQSPYEIFVRELVAMDGVDSSEITLIDARGCPTDQFIMGPIYKSATSGKVLLSHFDAFKFPSSEMVQFRALVTPCMPTCAPVQCDQDDFAAGELRSIVSYGRKRRSINATEEFTRVRRETTHQAPVDDMLLVESIKITDKFGFEKQQQSKPKVSSSETVFVASSDTQGICVNGLGLIVAAAIFLLGQLAVIAIWTFLWQRRRKQRQFENASMGSSVMPSPTLATSRGDSMCKLYDSGYAGRHF
ncbi:uncharacterized protein LOC129740317 [Uranotaenia lowii]|uniref:uncharacterized protein LOC129740317 n=1 Tax=Uranotaenia lowii TaxID=190385 RepID=UPI002478C1C8|nr:uncharacterized protein LOC129740317 [Uranotaenia lowii]XP_055587929.1 uncharacterized protein LOC129740317 [Uranotaenia lowii]XP_055587931.1 uncharacterized protein LOC129740317 [Uranotaenia lowii]